MGVLHEGDQDAERCGRDYDVEGDDGVWVEFERDTFHEDAADHFLAAPPDHASDRDRREDFNGRVVEGVGHDRVFEGVHVAAVDFGEAVVGLALAVEELQHDHAADVLLQVGIDAGDGGADAAVGVTHLVAENFRRVDDQREHGEGDQRQLPVHAEHDAEDSGEHEDVFEDRDYAGGEHFVQGVDVGGDAGDQASDGIFVVERDVHALQVPENLAAQVEHDFLPGPLHVIGLQKFEQKGEEQQADVDGGNLRDAGERARAEPTPHPGGCAARRREVAVDGDFGEVGAEHVAEGFKNDGDERNHHLPAIGTQVGEQTPHQAAVVRFAEYLFFLGHRSLGCRAGRRRLHRTL